VPRPTWIGRFLSLATRCEAGRCRGTVEVGQWAIEASRSCTRANSGSGARCSDREPCGAGRTIVIVDVRKSFRSGKTW
jgi:hypothetical protein